MTDRPPKILLYETEPAMVELLVSSLSRRFNCHLTCVVDEHMCADAELIDPHDLAIVDAGHDHEDGLRLASNLLSLSNRPVLMLMDEPQSDDVARAVRIGVCDVFIKPFPMADLLDAARQAMRRFSIERTRSAKYARMRDIVRRVVRERRDLNRRMDLVCRDLVGAQRRLVDRVLSLEARFASDIGSAGA